MKNILTILAVIVIGVLLFGWNRFFGTEQDAFTYWQQTDIKCIPGHQNLEFHFHPHLTIIVDGQSETVPANIGISPECMAELHMHDETGTIHIEGLNARDFHLSDFFAVWGKPIERDGYRFTVLVDGKPSEEGPNPKLIDKQQIVINYFSGSIPQ